MLTDERTRIKELEDELSGTKYNKRTEGHFAIVKAQIAKLREKLEKRVAKKSGAGDGFNVRKSGDASAVLLGYPSVGKSTLLNRITNAESRTASYAFTTLTVIPGILEYNHAKIQILDVPGIIAGASRGKGRGREVLSMVRTCDLILILIDALHPEHYTPLLKEIYDVGVRVNKTAPDVRITRKSKGGMYINTTVKLTQVTKDTLRAILREFKLVNCDVIIRSDITIDNFIDVIEGSCVYIPALVIINKIDLATPEQINTIKKTLNPDFFMSAEQDYKFEELKQLIFNKLNFIRIYLKEVGKKPDLNEPMILQKGATLHTICDKIHRDFAKRFRHAKIWGTSAKFDGQIFHKLDKHVADEDVVELTLS